MKRDDLEAALVVAIVGGLFKHSTRRGKDRPLGPLQLQGRPVAPLD